MLLYGYFHYYALENDFLRNFTENVKSLDVLEIISKYNISKGRVLLLINV